MKLSNILILFLIFQICCNSIQRQVLDNDVKKALQIVEKNKTMFDSIDQLIVVYNYQIDSYSAVLVALEKINTGWKVKYQPMKAGVGCNGFASPETKYEGDGKSPSGFFRFGQLFSYEQNCNTKLQYIQTAKEDKWIDDPESDDYNTYVRGETNAKSYENLLLRSDAYKYCMLIEYNTHPVVKGKGSAIFFHLGEEIPGSTAGCVAINETNMKLILSWMDPKLKPSIIMGNIELLNSGL